MLYSGAVYAAEIQPKCILVLSICCVECALFAFLLFLAQSKAERSHRGFEMHPVSAPSHSIHGETAGNDGNFIPVPQEPQNLT